MRKETRVDEPPDAVEADFLCCVKLARFTELVWPIAMVVRRPSSEDLVVVSSTGDLMAVMLSRAFSDTLENREPSSPTSLKSDSATESRVNDAFGVPAGESKVSRVRVSRDVWAVPGGDVGGVGVSLRMALLPSINDILVEGQVLLQAVM